MSKRKSLPRFLKREIEQEAGGRCAVPTCRQAKPLQIAHIYPYKDEKNHEFNNLILLCNSCHGLHGDDVQYLKKLKNNLAILNGRYSHFEMRILQYFLEHSEISELWLYGRDLDVLFLVKDGLLQQKDIRLNNAINFPPSLYSLTEEGKEFVRRWVANENLD